MSSVPGDLQSFWAFPLSRNLSRLPFYMAYLELHGLKWFSGSDKLHPMYLGDVLRRETIGQGIGGLGY